MNIGGPSATPYWFLHGPPRPEVIDGRQSSVRYAVADGRGWAVVSQPVHPRQVEDVHEFRATPRALLHELSYRLVSLNAILPADLVDAATIGPPVTDDAFKGGRACPLMVDEEVVLSLAWTHDGYERFIAIHNHGWLGALFPGGQARHLVTADGGR